MKMSSKDPQVAVLAVLMAGSDLPASPLLTVGSFRRLLVRGLQVSGVIGSAKISTFKGSKTLSYALANGAAGNQGLGSNEDAEAVVGGEMPLSLGDVLAHYLANGGLKGAPAYRMYWPEARRAEARLKLIAWFLDDSLDWLSIAKTSSYFRDYR